MNIKKLTTLALYTTLAIIIYSVETILPPLVPIPGVKLGLANIITLAVIHEHSGKDAFMVLMARIILSSFLFGQMVSLLYSLAGGVLCLFVMFLTNHLLSGRYICLTSIVGAIAHNIGQIAIAYFITSTMGVLAYLPFLMLSGIITGLFTGLCTHFLILFIGERIKKL